jgi:hypothetical protein
MIYKPDAYRPGERLVAQYEGGREWYVEAASGNGSGTVLVPLGVAESPPAADRMRGAWRVDPGTRLLRDWLGRYWRATQAQAGPGTWRLDFTRAEPGAGTMRYEAEVGRPLNLIGDAELARLLRRSWDSLATDAPERQRRLAFGSTRSEL